jgi:hypothetical protein
MRSAITLGLGVLLAVAAPGLRAQANPATPAKPKSAPAQQAAKPEAKPAPPDAPKPAAQAPKRGGQKPAAKPPAKPAAQAFKPAAKPALKPAAKAARKAPAKPPVKAAKAAAGGTAPVESEMRQARRDPFESLIGRQQGKAAVNLPPGKAGLQVSTLRLDGVVKAPNGMIAVVSNPQSRTYFLREGDHLYDGTVEKISMDGVSFHEEGKDAFGKPVERQVNKRIYSSSGEQQ